MSNKITFDAELILEKHCPSMSTLYLDDEGKKFRSRIVAAMKEYASLQTEVKETEKTAFDFLKANGIIRQLDTRVEVIQCNYLGLINVMNEYAVHYKNRVSKPKPEESQTELWKEFWGIMYKSSKNPREHFTISRKSPK